MHNLKKFTFIKISLFIFLIITNDITLAELLKPNSNFKAEEVISIQLSALKNNNYPYENAGIDQTWEFAHPSNRIFTGPLEKFTLMMYSSSFYILLKHKRHNIIPIKQNSSIALFFVELEDQKGNLYKLQWIVEKVTYKGEFENCWMTTSVSQPMLLEKAV